MNDSGGSLLVTKMCPSSNVTLPNDAVQPDQIGPIWRMVGFRMFVSHKKGNG